MSSALTEMVADITLPQDCVRVHVAVTVYTGCSSPIVISKEKSFPNADLDVEMTALLNHSTLSPDYMDIDVSLVATPTHAHCSGLQNN